MKWLCVYFFLSFLLIVSRAIMGYIIRFHFEYGGFNNSDGEGKNIAISKNNRFICLYFISNSLATVIVLLYITLSYFYSEQELLIICQTSMHYFYLYSGNLLLWLLWIWSKLLMRCTWCMHKIVYFTIVTITNILLRIKYSPGKKCVINISFWALPVSRRSLI